MTGRPSSYKPEFAKQAVKLCDLGATDEDLAEFFGVNVRTIARWKIEHDDFCQALKAGKAGADDRVERSLFQRAVGYSHDSVKILTVSLGNNAGSEVREVPFVEHYPPDTTAAIFWLKNRRPEQWRDKTEVQVTRSLSDMTDDELARIAAGSSDGTAPAPRGPSKPH